MASQQSHSRSFPGILDKTLTETVSVIIPKFEKASNPNTSKDPHATKKSKNKDGLLRSTEAGSDSEDELSIQEEEPPELTPAFLTLAAPTEEGQRALYHAVQAVWSPRNKHASAEKVRSGIAGYGDAVRALRDAWKVKNDNLKKAELPNSPTAKDADALKKEVARYRQLMEEVMTRSLKYGHLSVVKRYVVLRIPPAIIVSSAPLIYFAIASRRYQSTSRTFSLKDVHLQVFGLQTLHQSASKMFKSAAPAHYGSVGSYTSIDSPQIAPRVKLLAMHSNWAPLSAHA
jgi:hypothetical protein